MTGQGEEASLSNAEMEQLIQNVRTIRLGRGRCMVLATQSSLLFSPLQILEESDIDKDGTINLSEFQHVVSRSPDFARYCGLQWCSPRGLCRGASPPRLLRWLWGRALMGAVRQAYPLRGLL